MLDWLPVHLTLCVTDRCPDNYGWTVAYDLRFPVQHGAWWRLDNWFRDQAVTNARQLADLLNSADAPVVSMSG
jgi:hypothetical protein